MKYIYEHKFYGKSITDILNWLQQKADKVMVFVDSESTGLPTSGYEVQLTQVSGIAVKWDYQTNTFTELGSFDKKIKLTDKTLDLKKAGKDIGRILSFNHYGRKGEQYFEEESILQEFKDFVDDFDNPILVIQNAIFDMRYLNTRSSLKFKNEVIDTKQLLQLFYLPALQKLAEDDMHYKKLISTIGTSSRDNGLISSSLAKIGPALGLNMTGYHDALTDCRLAMKMFEKVVDFLKENTNVDISHYQAERIQTIRKN